MNATQTEECEGLMRSVIADKHSNAPRLILADWLDENEMPCRAEVIRMQCGHVPMDLGRLNWLLCICLESRRFDRDNLREDRYVWVREAFEPNECGTEVFETHGSVSFGLHPTYRVQLIDGGGTGWFLVSFQRGFVSQVKCAFSDWQTIVGATPILTKSPIERVHLSEVRCEYSPCPPIDIIGRHYRGKYKPFNITLGSDDYLSRIYVDPTPTGEICCLGKRMRFIWPDPEKVILTTNGLPEVGQYMNANQEQYERQVVREIIAKMMLPQVWPGIEFVIDDR